MNQHLEEELQKDIEKEVLLLLKQPKNKQNFSLPDIQDPQVDIREHQLQKLKKEQKESEQHFAIEKTGERKRKNMY